MLSQTYSPAIKLSDIPHHTRVQFAQPNEPEIFFNSKFDSGNLSKVVKNSYEHYSIWTASDAEGTEYAGYPKSWYYFQVGGFVNRKITFSIHRVHFLWALANKSHLYRPVYRVKQIQEQEKQGKYGQWRRLPYPVESITINSQEELIVKFDFYFSVGTKSVEFAFIYPYSHEQCHSDIEDIQISYENDSDIFVKKYQLCRSYEGRMIDMLLISSHEGKEGFENIKTDGVFTLGNAKLQKFKNYKPVIFISARVHPIQTPSSFTMTGAIKFLLDKNDYRAFLLRKYFVFVLVPMLNPDGVSNGHCRMDSLNQNLNRYYNEPDPIKQPSCYSVMKLCEHYNKEQKLFMYLDLHAHPANKGNFIFGNAIFDYIEQVQSHLFPKALSQNCISFEFQQCNFSRKQMKAKDRNQDMNKEGCGRVVFYKQFGLTHSYTLECGYHCNTYNNILQPQQNINKVYIVRYKTNEKNQNIYDNFEEIVTVEGEGQDIEKLVQGIRQRKCGNGQNLKIFRNVRDKMDNIEDDFYKKQKVFFQQQTFYNLGRNICISILDIWNKNPYTRITNLNEQRVMIAEKQAKLDRFRKQQVGIKTKQKKIVELIENQLYGEWYKRNVFQTQINIEAPSKKNLLRTSVNVKRVEKSLTITEAKEQIMQNKQLSLAKITISKNFIRTKKSVNKEQKKIGIVQPSIQSIKSIAASEFIKGPAPLKLVMDAKTFFKPFNTRLRNYQLNAR